MHAGIPLQALFSGASNRPLADEISYELCVPLSQVQLNRFSDGETSVQILESIRGKDVYIIQSTSQPVNEHLVELLLLISAARRASARTITAVIPYYGYKRDVGTASSLTALLRSEVERSSGAGVAPAAAAAAAHVAPSFPVSAADVAKMLTVLGVDRVLSVELQPPGQVRRRRCLRASPAGWRRGWT